MFARFFSKTPETNLPYDIYGTLVSKARNPALFSSLKVPDTIDGRFDMMILHIFLLSLRLKDEDDACRALSQEVFDAFLLDMDRGLREEGVGDLTVPKRIKKMTQVFYGRVGAYEEPVENNNRDELAAAIDRNVFPDGGNKESSSRLADYMLNLHAHLSKLTRDDLLRGKLALENVSPLI